MAKSLQHALRKEKRSKSDDCWVDDEWKKENQQHLESAIGFEVNSYDEDFYDGVALGRTKGKSPGS